MFQESIRSTQWEIQHQKQHVKQHVKHWFFATVVAGAAVLVPYLQEKTYNW